jgi:RND family efflux transporter MFP subunit
MNDVTPVFDRDAPPQPVEPAIERAAETPPMARRRGGRLVALVAAVLLVVALGVGAQRHAAAQRALAGVAEQHRTFVPRLRVATVTPGDGTMVVTLPATTAAFAAANIFARASGYVSRRNVDIGDRVTAGQVLAEITAPELDHQIAQANATLSQNQAALQQAQANKDLAQVTNERDGKLVKEGWVTLQQGDTDRLTLRAQQAAVDVAQANIAAQQAQLMVLNQQKAYQRVVAPFDGVITQRNIDVGSLVQADATSGTFMFTIMQSNVIRIQVYVPQDTAFGLTPGVEAVVHVPEIAGRVFRGSVTRIADALQPGTRTLLTEIDLPNPDGALTPGVYCTVELHIPRRTPLLMIPADALVFGPQGLQVAMLEQGKARMRPVTVTRDLGTQVEVQDGVRAGDQVILNPPVDLVDGSPVDARVEPAVRTGES